MNEMNRDGATDTGTEIEFSPEALAQLGDGHIAYVKAVRVEDFRKMFPQADVPQLEPDQLLEIHVGSEVDPVLVSRTSLCAAGRIAQDLADIGHGDLDTLLLERVGKEPKCCLFDRALARIGIGGLEVVGFLVLLREGSA